MLQNLVGEVVSFQYESKDSPKPNLLLMKVISDTKNPEEVKYLTGININYSLLPLPMIKNYIEKNENDVQKAYLDLANDYPVIKEWYRKYKFANIKHLQKTI